MEKQMIHALQRRDFESALVVSTSVAATEAATHTSQFHRLLRAIVGEFTTHRDTFRDRRKIGQFVSFLDQLATEYVDSQVRFARASASLYSVLLQFQFLAEANSADALAALDLINKKVETAPGEFESTEAELALNLALGKVTSLLDRTVAASYFSRARELNELNLIEEFYIDLGAITYFAESDFDTDAESFAKSIKSGIQLADSSEISNEVSILMSVDINFFRIYSPIFLFNAQQFPGIDFCIVICGTEDDVLAAREISRRYFETLSIINYGSTPHNVRFYHAAVPAQVSNRETFYASARFFAASLMLEEYSYIYAVDADLVADSDPIAFLREVRAVQFGVPASRGFHRLTPWRRYMAGNVVMSEQVLKSPVLGDLENYLANGLRREASWTLDQNALAFTIERNVGNYTNLGKFKRPFRQPAVRSTWEKNFKRSARRKH